VTVSELLRVADHLEPKDRELVRKAYERAATAHRGQRRLSGEDYVNHPLEVAAILADLQLDAQTLAAALLHDTVEDTALTADEVKKEFGPEVANLVEGVTKLGRISIRTDQQQQAENVRKMMVAMAEDLRVVLIKLADRLHNMRTLDPLPEVKRRKISRETLDIYAPLAHRLGIGQIKWELEDLAFRNLEPEAYEDVVKRIARKRHERETLVSDLREILARELEVVGISAEITGRPKHIYSVWQKMTREKKDFSEIYDLSAIRVQVDSVRDCYGVLGVVHSLWKPVPGRFKDYIAMPKSNGYQSLHTTVITHTGEPIEIQIRTHEMHRVAEFGVAAHWTYKEGGKDASFDQKLSWLRSLLEWQNEIGDSESFLDTVKVDLFQDEVYVFTPKGDVLNLPADSTPVDFAYRIHTEVGHHCIGAKVNGRMVPLDYELKNGEIVEILTSKGPHGPSRDWLNFVKSASAKERIRKWFKSQSREENVAKGRDLLDKELHRMHRVSLVDLPEPKLVEIAGDRLRRPVTPCSRHAHVAEHRRRGRGPARHPAHPQRAADAKGARAWGEGDPDQDRPVLPAGAGRRDCRLHDARARSDGAPRGLRQRDQRPGQRTRRARRLGLRGDAYLSRGDQDRGLGPAGPAARHRHRRRREPGQHVGAGGPCV